MVLPDVNVLVYAHRAEVVDHQRYARWLEEVAGGDAAFGLSDMVLSGFPRIVTHPRIFNPPTPLEQAMMFVEELRAGELCPGNGGAAALGPVHGAMPPGGSQRERGTRRLPGGAGNRIWKRMGDDGSGVARFPGLRWRHPLD